MLSGFLSDVGDVDTMAKNALTILKDDLTLAEFKKNALATAQKFDIKNILPLYEDLYRRAIAKFT
jgi:glycosyltransferase involved in cell wall biosynthesis